jgi:hypothetical protein
MYAIEIDIHYHVAFVLTLRIFLFLFITHHMVYQGGYMCAFYEGCAYNASCGDYSSLQLKKGGN